MTVHTFTFPAEAAGLAVEVRNGAAEVVATGTVGSADADSGTAPYSVDLPDGRYVGSVSSETIGTRPARRMRSLWRAYHDRIEAASIAAASGGVGAAETAYFVATGDVSASTQPADAVPVRWVADDRHDALPSWASIDEDGQVVLTVDAGTCAYSFKGQYSFDFSGTSPQTSGGNISNGFHLVIDGQDTAVSGPNTPGDGQDVQVSSTDGAFGTFAPSLVACTGFPFSDDIDDGTATPRAALTITRIAQAAVLPA